MNHNSQTPSEPTGQQPRIKEIATVRDGGSLLFEYAGIRYFFDRAINSSTRSTVFYDNVENKRSRTVPEPLQSELREAIYQQTHYKPEQQPNSAHGYTEGADVPPSAPNKPATPELTEDDQMRIFDWFHQNKAELKNESMLYNVVRKVFEFATLHKRASMQAKDTRIKELEKALSILHTNLLVVHKEYKRTIHYEVTKEILENKQP